MKGTLKIVSILLIAILLVSISAQCFAVDGIITGTDPGTNLSVTGGDKIQTMAQKVIRIIRYAAVIVGTILIAVFGIKFMLGSAEEKADYKKSFIPLIIGIIVVFGSTYLAQLIFNLAQ